MSLLLSLLSSPLPSLQPPQPLLSLSSPLSSAAAWHHCQAWPHFHEAWCCCQAWRHRVQATSLVLSPRGVALSPAWSRHQAWCFHRASPSLSLSSPSVRQASWHHRRDLGHHPSVALLLPSMHRVVWRCCRAVWRRCPSVASSSPSMMGQQQNDVSWVLDLRVGVT